jgi:DNA-binding LytR/AlgR family response regulator
MFYKQPALPEPGFLFIRIDYKLVKIAMADILFIEALDDHLKIHVMNRKPYVARFTMKAILEKLPASFVRVHRSFLVSFDKITSVRNKSILIAGEEIPVSSSYEEDFFKLIH